MNRPIAGWILAAIALGMLVLDYLGAFSPLGLTSFGIGIIPRGHGAAVASVKPGSVAAKQGIRPGDFVDVMAMPLDDRLRLQINVSPPGTAITVPLERSGTRRIVRLVAQTSAKRRTTFGTAPYLIDATITLLIVALIALRRPSVAIAALVFYGLGASLTFEVSAQFSWLPAPWFTIAAVFLISAFSTLPIMALVPFIARFPSTPVTRMGIARMRAADLLFLISAVLFTFETFYEPVIFGSWGTFDFWSDALTMLVVLLFTGFVYNDARGEARRRIAWVIAGMTLSAAGFAGYNFVDTISVLGGNTGGITSIAAGVSQLMQAALPVALGYAILRHRVLDVGFVLNRTMVYGVMTALVIIVVSLVDWLTSRVISEQRWALAVEALITIGFGFALNWIHARTERLIDRIVFRARHVAEKRIEYRIGALGFAASSTSVDDAVGVESARILDLFSAAVFGRLAASEPFARRSCTAWEDAALSAVDDDSLLVRMLRSVERPIILDDAAIVLNGAPTGSARPVIAIPIVAQHELIGFALFGNRRDGALPDPEEIALLCKLCAAAGSAYGAVEARQWRERAAILERSLATVHGTVVV